MRKIVDARDARTCESAARALGMSLSTWARRHGVDGRSLHAWSVNLRLLSSSGPGLIELVPTSPPSVPVAARYVVRVGDTVLEFGDDVCDETLARVVGVLRAC